MTVRKQREELLLRLMEEAMSYEHHLLWNAIAEEDVRYLEWQSGVAQLLQFAFGELSVHYRSFCSPERSEDCVRLAREAVVSFGIPNPWRLVEEERVWPDFPHNRAWVDQQVEEALWRMHVLHAGQNRWTL